LQYFWWGSVFLVAVPVMILLIIVGPTLLPEFRNPHPGRLDFFSALLSLVAVLAVIHGLKELAHGGLGPTPILSIVGGLVIGVLFVRRQQRLADPLIDLHLFRVPAFNATLAANTLTFFANFGVFVFIAQYLQLVLGLSPLKAGLWTTPAYLGFIVGSLLTSAIVRRVPPSRVMSASLLLAAVGLFVLTQVEGPSALPVLVGGSVLFTLGLAPVTTLATDIMVGSAPPERAGAAAAISETSSELGGALGIAILGSIGTAVYRGIMASVGPPEAQDTIGGAVAAASQLTEPHRAALLDAAADAFTRAFHAAVASAAVLLIGAGALAAVLVRPATTEARA
jgi:DHA2 family multidrug resistance protein-like MFS transporter